MSSRPFSMGFALLIACLSTGAAMAQGGIDDPIGRKIEQSLPAAVGSMPLATLGDQIIAAEFSPDIPSPDQISPMIAKLQIQLARHHVSPGVIDGQNGGNLSKAIFAYRRMNNLAMTPILDESLWTSLTNGDADPVLKTYVIQLEDIKGPFVPDMPTDYADMAKLDVLAYRNSQELLAEKFHMDEKFLVSLNPGSRFDKVGETIVVADTGKPQTVKVTSIFADKQNKIVWGFGEDEKIVVAYPATIGSSDLPSPTGRHAVKNVVFEPEYSYRPDVNFQQGDNTNPLRIPPGPNGPVGSVWIGLDKPTYGIHGSPDPSKIDKTNSHGCVRLTNWDAHELAKLVGPGVVVDFKD